LVLPAMRAPDAPPHVLRTRNSRLTNHATTGRKSHCRIWSQRLLACSSNVVVSHHHRNCLRRGRDSPSDFKRALTGRGRKGSKPSFAFFDDASHHPTGITNQYRYVHCGDARIGRSRWISGKYLGERSEPDRPTDRPGRAWYDHPHHASCIIMTSS
jgi:hypothetical protein